MVRNGRDGTFGIDGCLDGAGRIRFKWLPATEAHLVPFTKNVEWTIPGKFLYYATAMPRRTGAIPLIATTVDGRPIKLEGNPLHPASGGATDTFVQASILDLYDPSRSQRFVHKGKEQIAQRLTLYWQASQRCPHPAEDGAAFLVSKRISPTRERLRAELEKFPRHALVRLRAAPEPGTKFCGPRCFR